VSTVPTAANPAATAAALAAFFAVRFTFERVREAERFLVFAALLAFVAPRYEALLFARFEDFFEVRFNAFTMGSSQYSPRSGV
jgi:hypothetical protein